MKFSTFGRVVATTLGAALAATTLVAAVPAEPVQPSFTAAGDPAFSVDEDDLAAALECSDLTDEVGVDHEPVLLVHGTFTWGYEQYHASYSGLLDGLGLDWCTVTYPGRGLGDMQVSAEYVAYAIQSMATTTGRQVDIIGHSQGAILPRWAVKYWPSAAALVDDMILQAPPSHGTTVANPGGLSNQGSQSRPPVTWQFIPDSDFNRTLNAGDETPGDIDYTVLWATTDELVQPSYGPTPTAPLEGGKDAAYLTNFNVQDLCPGRFVDHLSIGFTDRVSASLAVLAMTTDGPLNLDALAAADLCSGPDEAGPMASGADQMESATGLPFGQAWRAFAGAFPDMFQRQEALFAPIEIFMREGEHPFTAGEQTDREPEIQPYAQDDLAAAPLPAASQGVAADACHTYMQGPPEQPCDAVTKVTHTFAEFCRTASDDHEECRYLNGQPVGDAQVSAYTEGWVAEAHALQRTLGDDLALRDSVFVATHNSYNGYGYTPTLSRMDANQTYSIYDQLRLDVRRVELDIHWWYDTSTGQGAPVTCHATSTHNSTPVSRHTGCTAEDTLDVALADIRAWLDNPMSGDDVIMVRLETHLENAANHDVTAAIIEDALGDDLYRPAAVASGQACVELPLSLTRAHVTAAGARVIAVGDCGYGSAAYNSAVFNDDPVRTEQTYRGQDYSYPSCGGHARPGDAWWANKWVREYEDATLLSSMVSIGGPAPQRVTPELTREWSRCGVNQPSFDHLTPTDNRLEALVWSFSETDLTAPLGDCAQHGRDGRMHAEDCAAPAKAPAACASGYGEFVLTAPTNRVAAAARCRTLGLDLGVARTGYEAQRLGELVDAAGAQGAWVDLAFDGNVWHRA